MGSKSPKVAKARATKAKAAKAKAAKPDESEATVSKPEVPQTPSITPPTPTTLSFPSDTPPANIDADFLPTTWDGGAAFPMSNSNRAASERRSRAVVGPEILAHLDKLSKLKERRVYDAEEEGAMIEQLGELMEEKIAQVHGVQGDEGVKEKIRSLMMEFKGARR